MTKAMASRVRRTVRAKKDKALLFRLMPSASWDEVDIGDKSVLKIFCAAMPALPDCSPRT
jgi:hypothetical protein